MAPLLASHALGCQGRGHLGYRRATTSVSDWVSTKSSVSEPEESESSCSVGTSAGSSAQSAGHPCRLSSWTLEAAGRHIPRPCPRWILDWPALPVRLTAATTRRGRSGWLETGPWPSLVCPQVRVPPLTMIEPMVRSLRVPKGMLPLPFQFGPRGPPDLRP